MKCPADRLKIFILAVLYTSQAAEVSLIPPDETTFNFGHRAIYNCLSTNNDIIITNFQWLLNWTVFEDLGNTDIIDHHDTEFRIRTLRLNNLTLENNNTNIQCRATDISGNTLYSNVATLLIKGLYPVIESLDATPIHLNSSISISWTAIFSPYTPIHNPDITYCVVVTNFTSSLMIHTECGITNTQFTYTLSDLSNSVCDTYTFTITPVNLLGSGISTSVNRGLLLEESNIKEESIAISRDLDTLNYLIILKVSAPVCQGNVSLTSVYGNYTPEPIEVTPDNEDNSISFIISGSNSKQLFIANIALANNFGPAISTINISTFNIQYFAYNIQNRAVTFEIRYIENIETSGALLALMYLNSNDSIMCSESVFIGIKRVDNDFTLQVDDERTNRYMGLTYDVGRNGVTDGTYPADREKNITLGSVVPRSNRSDGINSCNVTYFNGTATVSCVDSTSSVSEYQVILLQQNDQNNVKVVNVRSGGQESVPVVFSRYCIIEVPMKNNELMFNSEVRYSSEFIAEDPSTTDTISDAITRITIAGIIIAGVTLIGSIITVVIIMFLSTKKIKAKIKINPSQDDVTKKIAQWL